MIWPLKLLLSGLFLFIFIPLYDNTIGCSDRMGKILGILWESSIAIMAVAILSALWFYL